MNEQELRDYIEQLETRIYWLRWDVSCIVQGSPNPYDVLAAEQALKDDDMRAAGRDPFIEALNGGSE